MGEVEGDEVGGGEKAAGGGGICAIVMNRCKVTPCGQLASKRKNKGWR